jgi:AcrR family transcriptional regulator
MSAERRGDETRRPLQARAKRTREQILERAAHAFARDGYEGTSLNEVIRASGFTKGAFYFHFASKEELALATFRYKQEQIVERTLAEAERETDAEAELRTLLRIRARVYTEDPSARCILRLGAELGAKAGPDSEFARFQELTIETFAGIVRRGQAEGSMRADLDPRKAGEAIFGAMIGVDRVARLLSGGADLEQRGQELVDLLVHGLAGSGETAAAEKRDVEPRRERRTQ